MDMPRKLPLNVTRERTRHGRVAFYFRVGKGKRIRLPDITDPCFHEAYVLAVSGGAPKVTTPARESLKWAWLRYTGESLKWHGYSRATRKQHSLLMAPILDKVGSEPLSRFDRKAIQGAVNKRRETPFAAVNLLKAMTPFFDWCVRQEWIVTNPCQGIERPNSKTKGFPAWTFDDVASFRQKWPVGSRERLAMELMLLTGLRRSDACIVGLQHIRDGVLTVTTAKTGATIHAGITPAMMDLIKTTPRHGLTLIENGAGKPLTKESFGNWFGASCRAAGIAKSAHGLRKLSASIAAECGADAHAIMAAYGWENLKTAQGYTQSADRRRMALAASGAVSARIENDQAPHLNAGSGEQAISSKKTMGGK